jgi:site-specific DNA recombinase
MMADLRAGRFAVVLVWHLDRLYRLPRELEDMIDLCENGERRVESCYGDYDLSNPDGCFMARIMVANANKESADKSRRIRRKHVELAENGKRNGGGRTYGYPEDGMSLVAEEAEVIREGARRVLAGDTMRSICNDFYARGVKGAKGGTLGRSALRTILMSGRISGQREHHGVIVAPGEWPAIITPDETARLRAIFGDPARRSPGRGPSYLLSGFLRCGLCSARMVGRPRRVTRCYVCNRNVGSKVVGCGKMSRNADPVDMLVTEALFAVFDSPEMARAVRGDADDRGGALMAQIADDQAQLAELAAAYAAKEITMPEWLAARGPIQQRIDTANAEFAATTSRDTVTSEYVGRGGALREDWSLLSLDRQRAIIAGVIDHIVVEPATRGLTVFDPSKIKPVWKF